MNYFHVSDWRDITHHVVLGSVAGTIHVYDSMYQTIAIYRDVVVSVKDRLNGNARIRHKPMVISTIVIALLSLSVASEQAGKLGGFVGNLNLAHSRTIAPGSGSFAAKPCHIPTFLHRDADGYLTEINLYRKFHDYAWGKILLGDNINTVPDELTSNSSPSKGATAGSNVVANIRSISQFPYLVADKQDLNDNGQVLRLARSALLETQTPESVPLISSMTIHVLNFVSFPSPYIRGVVHNNSGNEEYLRLPIFGADIVSLPGNKHLVAIDFQPVLPMIGSVDSTGDERTLLVPKQFAHFESRLQQIHSKYQRSNTDSTPLLPWGGDIPPQAMRFFSPYALWTRLGDENAMETVNTVVWEAFQEYTDLYLELMRAVQDEVNAGKLRVVAPRGHREIENQVWKGQMDYLEYRRTNDPARPMLQRLFGNEWSERVISEVLFPSL